MKMLRPRIGTTAQPRVKQPVNWGKGRGGRPWERRRERIFERDKFLCQICLAAGRLTAVELHGARGGVCDHIVPLAQGGGDGDENLQCICKSCDKVKTQQESQGVG